MRPCLGIIGGTGFYRFFGEAKELPVTTPYGDPSAPVSVADVAGRQVAFLPRHGVHHQYLPSEVPYAANLWALRSLGARQVLAFNTVGSLQPHIRRGDFVFADQFVDRTSSRRSTIFTGPDGAHISTASPYCERMRALAVRAVDHLPGTFHPAGTVVVIEGPRFSTRAESHWFTQMGWHIVNMTQFPEVAIARELEMCYANMSYVTDYDVAAKEVAALEGATPVTHALVIREFSLGERRIEEVVEAMIAGLPSAEDCSCWHALDEARVAR
jgi:5'-methylthioadenosine phosphorylase